MVGGLGWLVGWGGWWVGVAGGLGGWWVGVAGGLVVWWLGGLVKGSEIFGVWLSWQGSVC